MNKQTIVGMLAASIAAGVALVAAAADIKYCDNGIWPKTACDSKGEPAPEFKEWFTDIPWQQKLGTYTGNKIDQAIVLPYDVLRPDAKTACGKVMVNDRFTGKLRPLSHEECMIEIGVTNIVGTLRTDTKYDPDDPKIKDAKVGDTPYCQDPTLPCIEVKLEVSNWWAQPSGSTLVPGVNTLNKQLFGDEKDKDNYPAGFVLSDATVYAPQMPWYMSHYCQSMWPADSRDPVCYADYFSTFNSAFNGNGRAITDWPARAGFSVYPSAPLPENTNHCQAGLDKCSIALARFDLTPVPSDPAKLQFNDPKSATYNDFLIRWFNRALTSFPDQVTPAERQRHFAWSTKAVGWEDFVYPQALHNPFQGAYPAKDKPEFSCNHGFDDNIDRTNPNYPDGKACPDTGEQPAKQFQYPRQCSLDDLAGAEKGDLTKVAKLRYCSLAYETHPNGFKWQWSDPAGKGADYGADFLAAKMKGNQYGRTSFLFAGVPGMQVPVTFLKDPKSESGLSLYEQVYNASIFSMYMPVANVADMKNAYGGRNYKSTEFYHALLMSNHNESDPWQFADGIRGKVLWHNEYRMTGMYDQKGRDVFRDRTFAASFNPADAKAPFHNETCDGCHVRNGSGIPINTAGKLDAALREFMSDVDYSATGLSGKYPDQKPAKADYTFTGKIRPMKLIFLDLRRDTRSLDASRYSEPLATPAAMVSPQPSKTEEENLYYNNKVMNYFGDSFHVTAAGFTYDWTYETYQDATKAGKPDRRVVKVDRVNAELRKTYLPMQIKLGQFSTPSSCQIAPPETRTTKPWPASCNDVNGDAITAAIAKGEVGYMHLNGKRLGNLSAIEAIPNSAITGFQDAQVNTFRNNKLAGEIIWNAGSRDGYKGTVRKDCTSKSATDCFIGRFGWIGDRASLEDQVANAAFVEMNMTTSEGYNWLYPNGGTAHPIRYAHPNCGPANKACKDAKRNADLTERDVERMADYARWLGNPTRSEFKVGLREVIAGEKVFRTLGCDTCHVIRRIDIVPDETMLNEDFRKRLATRIKKATGTGPSAVPFLSYIGTDLLMHDMGYLSQVADAKEPIRDNNGVVKRPFENYVQKIRTPALKGLGLNRFVTDSYRNTKTWIDDDTSTLDAACDFLLHDGRACDAIEAAFLHDGPAVDQLKLIPKLNGLSAEDVGYLRAFLYSL